MDANGGELRLCPIGLKLVATHVLTHPGELSAGPRTPTKSRHHSWLVFAWVVALVIILFAAAWIGLQPLARYATSKGLGRLKGYHATFDSVGVSVIPLYYRIDGLKFWKDEGEAEPLLAADHLAASLKWRKLVHRQLLLTAWIDGAALRLVETPKEKNPAKRAIPLADQLRAIIPLDVDRLQIRRSEVVYVFGATRRMPALRVTDIEATLENLVTRPDLEEGTATLALAARVQRRGTLEAFVSADPLQKGLTFAGSAKLLHLPLAELGPALAAKTGVRPTSGTLDVLARFECKGGHVTGGVKPELKGAQVKPADNSLGAGLKAAVADESLELFSNRVPDRNAVATVIPIRGDIQRPDIQLWPTVLGVIRNAFVEGVSETFRELPPPTAQKPNLLDQLRSALNKSSPPPKAQPPRGEGKRP